MTSDFAVHYFQVNAALDYRGDCAVALLVKNPSKDGDKPTLKSAILIDAGNTEKTPACLVRLIKRWESEYTIPPDQKFRFDAVTISHWDADHVGGFYHFLNTTDAWEFDDDDDDDTPKKFKYFKYDKDNNPLTRLYCIQSAATMGYATFASITFHGAGNSDALVTCDLHDHSMPSEPAMISCRTIKVNDYNPVIGRNVFTGNEVVFPDKSMDMKTITSVADLLKYNSPSAIPRKNSVNYSPPPSEGEGTDPDKEVWEGAPGLYIVGVNKWTLSQFDNRYDPNESDDDDDDDSENGDESGDKLAAAQSNTSQPDGGFGTVNIKPTGKQGLQNPNSLIMILVWPDPIKVSLYTGGDAEFGVENRVADFLKGLPVTVVKLGHHGSAAGTSMKFISDTKPSYVVLSAGTKHGHPAPETLAYLDAWYGSQTQPNDLMKPIQSISYPYTFGAVNDLEFNNFPRYFNNKLSAPLKLTTDALTTSGLKLYKPWVTECQKLWKASGRTDIINAWTPKIKSLEEQSKRANLSDVMIQIAQIVAQALKDSWRDWGSTSMAFYPERAYDKRDSAEEDDEALNFPKALKRLEAVKVILMADAASDGKTWSTIERPTSDTKSLELTSSDLGSLTELPDDPPDLIPVMIKANEAPTGENGKVGGTPGVRNKRQKLTDTRVSITDGLIGLELTLDEENAIIELSMAFDELTLDSDDDMVDAIHLPMASHSKLGFSSVSGALTAGNLVFDKIYRSDAQPQNNQQKFLTTDPESEADFFLSSTTSGFLTLATGIPSATTGQSWTKNVSIQDPLMVFVSACFNGPVSVSSLSITGQPITQDYSTTITEAKLGITISGVNLSFSSTASNIISVLNLTTNGTTSQPSDCQDVFASNGFFTNSNGVMLALTTDPATVDSTTCSMSDIFKFIGFQLSLGLKETTTLHMVNSSPNENIVWIDLTSRWTLSSRLTFRSTSNDSWLTFPTPGLTFSNWSVVVAKESRPQRFTVSGTSKNVLVNSGTMTIRATALLDGSGYSFDTYVCVAESSVVFSLRWNDRKNNPLGHLFDWISKSGINAQNAWSNIASALGTIGSSLYLREFSVTASHGVAGWQFQTVSISFELGLEWGITDPSSNPENRVPIWFCFTYSQNSTAPYIQFHGGLWPLSADKQRMFQKLNPRSSGIPPLEPSFMKPQYSIPLNKVYGASNSKQVDSIPGWLPSIISRLEVDLSYSFTTKATTVAFIGSMTTGPSKSRLSGPTWLSLENVNIRASYTTAQSLDFELRAQIILKPRDQTTSTPTAVVNILVGYEKSANSSIWRINGTVADLVFGLLYSYFDANDGNEALMDVMQDIELALVEFDFDHTSSAQSFLASGRLQLGPVWLDLVFNYGSRTKNGSGWEFYANISEGFVGVDTTVGEILLDISQSLAMILPSFIKSIELTLPDDCTIRLDVTKATPGDLGLSPSSNSYILFSVRVRAGDFEFSFVQITQIYEKPSSSNTSFTPPPTKMMFKATMDKLPILTTVPLVSNFAQPFDQIDLIWSSHDLTREEVEMINAKTYIDQTDQLVFNDPRLNGTIPGNSAADVVMTAGCHFTVVVQENNVPVPVIDYKFSPVSNSPAPKSLAPKKKLAAAAAVSTETAAATATWTKTFGPFTISAITLKYEDPYLNIYFNATVNFGPIKASVTGLGLGLPLTNFPHFPTLNGDNGIKVYFAGVGLELDTPPVKLAGAFLKTANGLEGGISIEIEPYMILAGGGVYHAKDSNGLPFDSTFIFAELSGPFIELEFASINDLVGGVGVNSGIVLPELETITTFPFLDSGQVKTQGAGGVLDILNQYLSGKWISPKKGTTWVAGGVGVNAFQTLEIKAVVVIDLADDPIFGVFADMVAEVPSGVTNNAELFARMDMGVIAELNPHKGTFICHGQLNPSSFILSSQCHLLGGFALCYWFSGSGHEGDWVFTVGGYHSQFTPPTWYPVPPRVSISWQYSNEISIFGEAFFAITPKVCMGGGDLKVNFASGNLSAYLTAWADFLVNYKPFSFIASVGVTVGASYTLHLGFCSKSFSVHLGCSLDLHGPPLAGVAHVDWSIISFDIHFGQANPPTAPLLWDQFCALVRQVDTVTDADKVDKTTGQHMHTISQTAGSMTSQASGPVNASSTDKWQVNSATFAFRMDTKFPVTRISYGNNHDDEAGPVYLKPMHNTTNIQSELTITFTPNVSFQYLPILKQIPVALWGQYDGTQDPSTSGNSQNLGSLLSSDNSTISRVMGMDIVGFTPTESADMLQFNIGFGSSYAAATANLPSSLYVSNGAGDLQSLDQAMNLSTPLTPSKPYQPRTVLGRIQNPLLAKNDLINSWITWSNIAADSTLATSLRNLGSSTGSASAWTKELSTAPTMPLPLLAAEATVKALMNDGTRFASLDGFQGTAGILNRDWLDGGSV